MSNLELMELSDSPRSESTSLPMPLPLDGKEVCLLKFVLIKLFIVVVIYAVLLYEYSTEFPSSNFTFGSSISLNDNGSIPTIVDVTLSNTTGKINIGVQKLNPENNNVTVNVTNVLPELVLDIYQPLPSDSGNYSSLNEENELYKPSVNKDTHQEEQRQNLSSLQGGESELSKYPDYTDLPSNETIAEDIAPQCGQRFIEDPDFVQCK